MKKQTIILLICCMVVTGIFNVLSEASEEGQPEKLKKAHMAGMSKLEPEKEEVPSSIDIASLKEIASKDITTMQIYRLESIDQKLVKKYLSVPFGEDSRKEVEAIMRLIKDASKMSQRSGEEIDDPDRALVIRLINGSVFEIFYNSKLGSPFADVRSRKLKEALYSLSCNSNSLAIMQLKADKTIEVTRMSAASVQHDGVTSNGIVTLDLNLATDGRLILDLKVRDSSKSTTLVDRKKEIQYGQAVVFEVPNSKDIFIAYLLDPR